MSRHPKTTANLKSGVKLAVSNFLGLETATFLYKMSL